MRKFYAIILSACCVFGADAAVPKAKMPRTKAAVGTPQVLPATDITADGFTANWKPVAGADGYAVFVYSAEDVTKAGRYSVLYENFNLISQGSVVEPVFIDEMTTYLADYGLTYTPDWTISQCILAGGKVGGVIWTPYVDVRADGGKYRVNMTIMGYAGQEIVVESVGSRSDQRKFLLPDNGNNEIVLEFDNGTQDTYMRIVDNGFPDDTEGLYIDKIAYLDDIEVSQMFEAGERVYHLVATGESETTSLSFAELPFRYDQTRLFYDLYAASIYYPDPDDMWDYEMSYSDFSAKQEVLLTGHDSIEEIAADAAGGPVEVFDLSGRRIASGADAAGMGLPAGLYVVRGAAGVSKLIVK